MTQTSRVSGRLKNKHFLMLFCFQWVLWNIILLLKCKTPTTMSITHREHVTQTSHVRCSSECCWVRLLFSTYGNLGFYRRFQMTFWFTCILNSCKKKAHLLRTAVFWENSTWKPSEAEDGENVGGIDVSHSIRPNVHHRLIRHFY